MYVVTVSYTAPLQDVDYALPDHCDWLAHHYEAGHFLVSGRLEPRTGGVIIAAGMTRDKLTAILATDPFAERRLARHDVVEFHATRTAPALHAYNEAVAETA